MPQATRDIKRRIKSVTNTHKITKAMELVAASKMRKAVAKVLATRSYADLTWATVLRLVKRLDALSHPFFQEADEIKNVAVVLISTNRGLCGSFNSNLVMKVVDSIKLHHPDSRVTDLITLGSRGRDEARRHGLNIIADFDKEDITQDSTIIRPVANIIIKDFVAKKYDKVFVAYVDFQSSLKQMPHVKQLLPIVPEIDDRLGHIVHSAEKEVNGNIDLSNVPEFVFEPGRHAVLEAFLPRLLEIQTYQAVLESEASEHSARMFAMRNASDAATEMINELTLAYNQARQAGITAELAEISAGAASLE